MTLPTHTMRRRLDWAYKRDGSFSQAAQATDRDSIRTAGTLSAADLDFEIQFRQILQGHGEQPVGEGICVLVEGSLREVMHDMSGTTVLIAKGNGATNEYVLTHEQNVILRPDEFSISISGDVP